jgi:hypothetical protein
MAIADRMETTVCETETYVSERENARVSISRMSSTELLRFGVSAKLRLSQGPTPNNPHQADLAAQLSEARSEWNQRHPNLPLRDSF